MTCYRPSLCTRVHGGYGGVVFGRLPLGVGAREFEVACNKCIGCVMARGLMWKTRILHEAKCWPSNLFLTLTYAPDKLYPCGVSGLGQLHRPHFQAFMDRLRERVSGVRSVVKRVRKGTKKKGFFWSDDAVYPVRYFMCGEYGGETQRPHYHAVLFNVKFADGKQYGNSWRSPLLEELWSLGQVQYAPLNSARAGYVAGYVVKKAERRVEILNRKTGEVFERTPEFQGMSSRPGLGAYHFAKYAEDFVRTDRAVVDGKEVQLPRYYGEKLKVSHPEEWERIREKRIEEIRKVRASGDLTFERRAVREEFQRLRHKAQSRRRL